MVALRLELDNMTTLPDGGPTFLEVQGRRSVDIGRNTYLDWSLPDPSRVVSGKHCEIHYRDGGYWLTDVSTNGTYLNGSDSRLTEPTRLQTGDRLAIGDYLINVTVQDEDGDSAPAAIPHTQLPVPPAADAGSLWDVPADAIAPAEPRERRRTAESTPVQADVLDWIADIPQVDESAKTPLDPAPELTEVPASPVPPAETAPPAPPSADALTQGAFDPPTEQAPDPIAPAPVEDAPVTTEPSVTAPIVAGPSDAPSAPEPDAAPVLPSDPDPTPALAELGATAFDPPAPAAPDDALSPTTEAAPEETWSSEPAPTEVEDVRAAESPLPEIAEPQDWSAPPEPVAAQPGGFGAAAEAANTAHRPAHQPTGADFERFMVTLAEVLDVPRERLESTSPEETAQRVGQFIALSISGMQRLLKARATSRGYMRAGPGTQVQAVGNNPLKFMPTPAAAADVLFGPPSRSYLSLEDTLDESFADLGAHQMALYSAMQGAVERMLKDLEPDVIEGEDGDGGSFLSGKSSKKAKNWDTYKERYTARASQHDNGMVDVFMMCFADAYERAIKDR